MVPSHTFTQTQQLPLTSTSTTEQQLLPLIPTLPFIISSNFVSLSLTISLSLSLSLSLSVNPSLSVSALHQWHLFLSNSSLHSLSSYSSPFSHKPISLSPSDSQNPVSITFHPPSQSQKQPQMSMTSSNTMASQRVSSQTTSTPSLSLMMELSLSSSLAHVTSSLTSWFTMTRKSLESSAMAQCPVFLGFKPKSCSFGSPSLECRLTRILI